ncbi:LPS export ABC transporter periplasmic protein LptC [Marivirga harenae]|uniref:LPS export ABC transporter periplasmic protein LptC n=1 Tax=Marivirga harenae TaxID=2010992 RepID=UPI0026E02F63|nr:LPS export ABC transporter periplasmic protein LptC [Marivirga harenae]WKV13577.1 LPS export ABC transporter periplasmic protein LptC [Marivirga harenae]|tara:strand:- start:217738 stop:218406 length:669 start_codon:yes stop_codon:yes gene_type:complete
MKHFHFLLLLLLGQSCSSGLESKQKFEEYSGPIMEADTIEIIYSDSAKVRVIVNATKQYEFENGDREFPNDIYIEFFEPDGTMSSTLEANSAYYTKETEIYKAEGDVEVIGYIEPRKLNSEELYWEPEKEEIYTETFVRIQSEDQISTGTGLRAKQDFSSYRILNPSGTIYLEEPDSTSKEENQTRGTPRKTKQIEGDSSKKLPTKKIIKRADEPKKETKER